MEVCAGFCLEFHRYGRPLDVKDVEEFIGMAQDVGAHRAALVSAKGYSETAKARAKMAQVDLYTVVDTPFGLAAVIFSADEVRAEALAMQIDAGMVFVNRPAWTAPDVPFGGVKHSGYGRELSELGIQEFVNKKLIEVNSPDTSEL